MPRVSLAGLVALAAFVLPFGEGCAQDTEEDASSSSDSALVSAANEAFQADIAAVERITRKCQSAGACPSDGVTRPASLSIATTDSTTEAAHSGGLRDLTMCDALRPFARLEHPYFFVGASAKAAFLAPLKDGGFDTVWDLEHRQLAIFHYESQGLQNLVGVEAAIYLGYAFGRRENVLDAWSGEFEAVAASFEIPLLEIGVGGRIFRAPDNSMFGGAVVADVGLNMLGHLASVSVEHGEREPSDGATRLMGDAFYFVPFTTMSLEHEGAPHTYLQFAQPRDLALALVETFGAIGVNPAGYALARNALEQTGLTYEHACPQR